MAESTCKCGDCKCEMKGKRVKESASGIFVRKLASVIERDGRVYTVIREVNI